MYIYILELEYGKYYIGKTTNPHFRLDQHFKSSASVWTSKFRPQRVISVQNGDSFDEDKFTLKYMSIYGIDNVRGGSFCQLALSDSNKTTIQQMIFGSTDSCYKCQQVGHFAKDCTVAPLKTKVSPPLISDTFSTPIYPQFYNLQSQVTERSSSSNISIRGYEVTERCRICNSNWHKTDDCEMVKCDNCIIM